jgi:Mg2+ and Co2+ transporter CorA
MEMLVFELHENGAREFRTMTLRELYAHVMKAITTRPVEEQNEVQEHPDENDSDGNNGNDGNTATTSANTAWRKASFINHNHRLSGSGDGHELPPPFPPPSHLPPPPAPSKTARIPRASSGGRCQHQPPQQLKQQPVLPPTSVPYRERLGGYLHPRDMRRLVTPFSNTNEPELIVRRHVMLFNFDPLRAIVLRDRLLVLVPDGADGILMRVEKRLRGGFEELENDVYGDNNGSGVDDEGDIDDDNDDDIGSDDIGLDDNDNDNEYSNAYAGNSLEDSFHLLPNDKGVTLERHHVSHRSGNNNNEAGVGAHAPSTSDNANNSARHEGMIDAATNNETISPEDNQIERVVESAIQHLCSTVLEEGEEEDGDGDGDISTSNTSAAHDRIEAQQEEQDKMNMNRAPASAYEGVNNDNHLNDDEHNMMVMDDVPNEWEDIDNRLFAELPFELLALDVVMEAVVVLLLEDAGKLNQRANTIMKSVYSNTNERSKHQHRSTETNNNMEHLRVLKDKVKEMDFRIKGFTRAIDQVLNDDEDMALMNLSRLLTHPERFIMPVSPDILNEESDEPELILEAYLQQALTASNSLELLSGQITTTEQLIDMKLDTIRNRLLFVNTVLSMIMLFVSAASLVGSIFGMNLINGLEDSPTAFRQVVIGTLASCVVLFAFVCLAFRNNSQWLLHS